MSLQWQKSGNMTTRSFVEALASDKPAADRADKMSLYGWLIGRWTMDATLHLDNGGTHRRSGENVWILPGGFYGTTLRVYDPNIDAWHILWSDPMRQFYTRQIGRAQGADIVQLGHNDAGEAVRWSFTAIKPDSFRWLGERSRDDGKSWQLQAEFLASRIP